MDLFNYRIIFYFTFIILFYSCEESIINNNEDDSYNSYILLNTIPIVNYDEEENIISMYVETTTSENIISIVGAVVNDTNNDGDYLDEGEIIYSRSLVQSENNSNVFLHDGYVRLSNDVYIYDFIFQFKIAAENFIDANDNGTWDETEEFEDFDNDGIWDDETILNYPDTFTTNIAPKIISYSMPATFQLAADEWSYLAIDIEIENLNGLDNIDIVKFEIKSFLNDCNGGLPPENSSYESYDTWVFQYVNSDPITGNHWYHVDFPMRPLNGSALTADGVCPDTDNDGVCDRFEASECGKTGSAFFKFIVIDKDGLVNQVIDVPLEITD